MKNIIPVTKGDKVELAIQGISYQCWGISRFEGFTVFVPGSLPGETVSAEIVELKKNFAVGRIVSLIEPSPLRTEPRCPVYDECGGCQLQHAQYPQQLELKGQILSNIISRMGKQEDPLIYPFQGMDEPWAYRNRVQFQVGMIDDKMRLGFFRPETHLLVPTVNCCLLPETFNKIASFIEETIASGSWDGLVQVVIKESAANGEIAVILVTRTTESADLLELAKKLTQKFPLVKSVIQNSSDSKKPSLFGPNWQTILGKERLEDQISGMRFSVSPGSFVQVNSRQTETLYNKVVEYAALTGTETVIDAYCGIGTISLVLAKKARKVLGVEEMRQAVQDAKFNAQLNRIEHARFFAGKAEEILPDMLSKGVKADVIVVDPPRKGCEPAALQAIIDMAPTRIVYVSCNPVSLARDLVTLTENGYQLVEIQPVDMFPQTEHVESVVLLSRTEGITRAD